MFDRKQKEPLGPVLLDRVMDSGCRRVAILGLHSRAGARTVLASLVGQLHRRQVPPAVTSVPRLPPEAEIITADPVTRIPLPAGVFVATAASAAESAGEALEAVEQTSWETPLGVIQIYRVARDADVDLYGPDESVALVDVLERLERLSGGPVLVDGGWERRAFAAPEVTDGIVIVLAAGYSATPERSAAAARYHVETLTVPSCAPPMARAWHEAAEHGTTVLLDIRGRDAGVLPPGVEDPLLVLRALEGPPVSAILLPHGLNDEFMIPLVRSTFRCTLVVRDATRIGLAPIYFQAWLRGEGRIQVVRPVRLIAAATNPINPAGPDADASEFRQAVAAALEGIHVHDVLLESEDSPRKPAWKFWT